MPAAAPRERSLRTTRRRNEEPSEPSVWSGSRKRSSVGTTRDERKTVADAPAGGATCDASSGVGGVRAVSFFIAAVVV